MTDSTGDKQLDAVLALTNSPLWPECDAVPHDPVLRPAHYVGVVPGVECIQVTEHFSFCRGNAIKYLWRAGSKGDWAHDTIQDLEKAIFYIKREIASLTV